MPWMRRRSFRVILRYGIGLLVSVAACEQDARQEPGQLPVVAVPVGPVAGVVRALVPDGALEIVVLVPPGANPATHEPSIRDLRSAATAQLYLEIGHPSFVFEQTWLEGMLEGSSADRVRLFDRCPILAEDPHAWLSTACLAGAAEAIADVLTELMPEYEEQIAGRLRVFRERLGDAEASAARRLAAYRGRRFFVLHPAWGYFARDHGLEQVEILSHGAGDPGASRLAELIQTGREGGIRTVFVQPQFNPEPAELVAGALGAGVISLNPLGDDPVSILEETTAALETAFAERDR